MWNEKTKWWKNKDTNDIYRWVHAYVHVVVIIGVREGILLGGAEKFCPENNNLP